jgi:hypothetical protein
MPGELVLSSFSIAISVLFKFIFASVSLTLLFSLLQSLSDIPSCSWKFYWFHILHCLVTNLHLFDLNFATTIFQSAAFELFWALFFFFFFFCYKPVWNFNLTLFFDFHIMLSLDIKSLHIKLSYYSVTYWQYPLTFVTTRKWLAPQSAPLKEWT